MQIKQGLPQTRVDGPRGREDLDGERSGGAVLARALRSSPLWRALLQRFGVSRPPDVARGSLSAQVDDLVGQINQRQPLSTRDAIAFALAQKQFKVTGSLDPGENFITRGGEHIATLKFRRDPNDLDDVDFQLRAQGSVRDELSAVLAPLLKARSLGLTVLDLAP
jgi:hypothetical protein